VGNDWHTPAMNTSVILTKSFYLTKSSATQAIIA